MGTGLAYAGGMAIVFRILMFSGILFAGISATRVESAEAGVKSRRIAGARVLRPRFHLVEAADGHLRVTTLKGGAIPSSSGPVANQGSKPVAPAVSAVEASAVSRMPSSEKGSALVRDSSAPTAMPVAKSGIPQAMPGATRTQSGR